MERIILLKNTARLTNGKEDSTKQDPLNYRYPLVQLSVVWTITRPIGLQQFFSIE
jgi:hypothetical protein